MNQKTVMTLWTIRFYEVWRDCDGYTVNDISYTARDIPIRLKIEVNNPGSKFEFESAYPSDYQIKKILGVSCKLDLSGDDTHIYIDRARDGYPIASMTCESHESLSPIRSQ